MGCFERFFLTFEKKKLQKTREQDEIERFKSEIIRKNVMVCHITEDFFKHDEYEEYINLAEETNTIMYLVLGDDLNPEVFKKHMWRMVITYKSPMDERKYRRIMRLIKNDLSIIKVSGGA